MFNSKDRIFLKTHTRNVAPRATGAKSHFTLDPRTIGFSRRRGAVIRSIPHRLLLKASPSPLSPLTPRHLDSSNMCFSPVNICIFRRDCAHSPRRSMRSMHIQRRSHICTPLCACTHLPILHPAISRPIALSDIRERDKREIKKRKGEKKRNQPMRECEKPLAREMYLTAPSGESLRGRLSGSTAWG